ncbi:MAG TPA: glycosyltransferase [Aquihabitans sp.]|nr:glycosyltransferase [Aquihabitans sp.]
MSVSPHPSVAVVVTTYDHAHFLDAAIGSVLAQTVAPAELIVVDDGSHDRPEEVTRRHPSACLIRQANAGLAAARNTGWQAASSELVVFLDADDRLLPEAIAGNLGRLAEAPEAAFAYGAYVDVHVHAGRTSAPWFVPAVDGYESFLRGNPIGMHATVAYRRSHLDAVGGFDPSLRACEDYDLYLRLAQRFPVAFGPDPIAEYWHHGANMSLDAPMMLDAALTVLGRHEEEARRRGAAAAHDEGVAAWKRHYVDAWAARALVAARSRRVDREVLRQGVALARLAPGTVARAVAVAPSRLARRARRRLRARGRGRS